MSEKRLSARAFVLYWVFDPRPVGALDRAIALIERSDARLAIQVRPKGAGLEVHRDALDALSRSAQQRGVGLFVNEHLELAVDGVGVHLTERCPTVDAVRARLGPDVAIGASCHDAAGLQRRGDADFVVLGPVLPVAGKGEPLGWPAFAVLASAARTPVFALGGIGSSDHVVRARDAGAVGFAISRALESDSAPEIAAALLAAWSS